MSSCSSFFKESFEYEDAPFHTLAKHMLPSYTTRDVRDAVLLWSLLEDVTLRISRQSSQKHLPYLESQQDDLQQQLEWKTNKFGKVQRALYRGWINKINREYLKCNEKLPEPEEEDDSWLTKPTFGGQGGYSHNDEQQQLTLDEYHHHYPQQNANASNT